MKYINKSTKAVITTNGEISGGDWEEFKEFIEETVQEEPEAPEEPEVQEEPEAPEEPEVQEEPEKAPAKKTKGKKDAK